MHLNYLQKKTTHGCGSKSIHQGTAAFGPCCHLPGFHFGVTLFLTHSHMGDLHLGGTVGILKAQFQRLAVPQAEESMISWAIILSGDVRGLLRTSLQLANLPPEWLKPHGKPAKGRQTWACAVAPIWPAIPICPRLLSTLRAPAILRPAGRAAKLATLRYRTAQMLFRAMRGLSGASRIDSELQRFVEFYKLLPYGCCLRDRAKASQPVPGMKPWPLIFGYGSKPRTPSEHPNPH